MTHLYGLTIQGIQSYIFDTNKLKEIVGASEIIELVCTTWFDEFIKENQITGTAYLQAAGNIRYNTDEQSARVIFKYYHQFLLKKAPGVPMSQAVVIIGDDKKAAIEELDTQLSAQRNIPMQNFDLGSMGRFIARGTGAAAILLDDIKDTELKKKRENIDSVTYAKFKKGENSDAIAKKLNLSNNPKFPTDFETIADGTKHSWLALVHIDGNGMGDQIRKIIKDNENNPFTELKKYSEKVGACTLKAFGKALEKIIISKTDINEDGKKQIPLRPLILGGDDLTVILRANFAIPFAKAYLEAFEKETKTELDTKITACAGIAFVKEKFPFHFAANLAEDLTKFAKNKSNRKASCLHFHRVQDSFIEDYCEIIDKQLTPDNQPSFVNGPYYLTSVLDKNHQPQPTIDELLKDCNKLKKEDSPINGMREWVDLKFNNPIMAEEIMKRLITNSTYKNYANILKNEQAFIDYQTLLAVNTQLS